MSTTMAMDSPWGLRLVPASESGTVCKLCFRGHRSDLGELYEYVVDPLTDVYCAHYFCLLFSAGLEQRGEEDEGIQGFLPADILREWRRGGRLKCCYCTRQFATLGCSEKTCRKTFHLPCSMEQGDLHQFDHNYATYCQDHRPEQRGVFPTAPEEEAVCGVCLEPMAHRAECLWGPCCQGWYHRTCIQTLARTTGYFFKCPLCNNAEEFGAEMRAFGVFVPEQDAAWELEEAAYESLLERHGHCDAEACQCPGGRTQDEDFTAWEIILCQCCGASGIHIQCAGKKPVPAGIQAPIPWTCSGCRSVVRRLPPRYVNHYERVRNRRDSSTRQRTQLLARGVFKLQDTTLSVECQNVRLSVDLMHTGPSPTGPVGTLAPGISGVRSQGPNTLAPPTREVAPIIDRVISPRKQLKARDLNVELNPPTTSTKSKRRIIDGSPLKRVRGGKALKSGTSSSQTSILQFFGPNSASGTHLHG